MKAVLLGLFSLLFLQAGVPSGKIQGVVLKAGTAFPQPLQDARLELRGPRTELVVRSESNGNFAFPNLAPGEYRLQVSCDGFVRQEFPRKIVVRSGAPPADIRFELDSAPVATGWVLDANGEAKPGVLIEALRRSYDFRGNPGLTRAAAALTDDRGRYRIFWLDPGEYFFYVSTPPPGENDPAPVTAVAPTYFPGVTAPEDAKPVPLRIGSEVRVDFRIQSAALWSVRGHIQDGTTNRAAAASVMLFEPVSAPALSRFHAQTTSTGFFAGEFVMKDIPPGNYLLTAKGGGKDSELSAVQRITLRAVSIAAQPPVYSVTLELRPPFSLNGRLYVDSADPFDTRSMIVKLRPANPDFPQPPPVSPLADGQFVIKGIVPGTYAVETANLPPDFYLKGARSGDVDILVKGITFEKAGTAEPLHILVASGGGHLQVSALDSNGDAHPGAQVVLVPAEAERRAQRDQYRVAAIDEDGKALLGGIPPGAYKLFAWESIEPYAYLNAGFMLDYEAAGVPLHIASGGNPEVSVRLIPKK